MDVVDIGYKIHESGAVIALKLLGVLAMIDEGETDWKVIGIDINDPLASKLSDVSDVDVYMPGLLKTTIDWFKLYKVKFNC